MAKANQGVLNFEPNVKQSQRSINKTIMAPAKKPINNIKGVEQHMKRIMEAQKKKIEDASFFLLPAQKAQILKREGFAQQKPDRIKKNTQIITPTGHMPFQAIKPTGSKTGDNKSKLEILFQ